MDPMVIIIFGLAILLGVSLIAYVYFFSDSAGSQGNISKMVNANRDFENSMPSAKTPGGEKSALNVHSQGQMLKQTKHYGQDDELGRKLRCSGMNIMPITFRCMQLAGGLLVAIIFVVFGFGVKILWLPFGFGFGYLLVSSVLAYKVQKRFKNFDNDYPNFLLSLCGLLKTGMNPMQAIEVAVEQMDDTSLLKQEVKLMVERLRFGVTEEVSIGSFGETIDHPEIELFVQALMLSRRLGGTLSDTLERLAKQVRKRQFFRSSANSAVSLQRGSVWVIIGILMGLMLYILVVYPPLVTEGFSTPIGQIIWQVGLMLMMIGIWWVRQITKLRI